MRGVNLVGVVRSRGVKYLCYSILDTQVTHSSSESDLSHQYLKE